MMWRVAGKIGWIVRELTVVAGDYLFTTAFVPEHSKRTARAKWLHRSSCRYLKIFGCSVNAAGPIPQGGLLVSNHLSYLDILVISAVAPAVFVSKSEVRQWPLLGWLAKLAGTVFIERARRTHVGAVNREIQAALAEGALVVVFPEGASSNGETILPFRSSLLEPVLAGGHKFSIACLDYRLPGGDVKNEVCYWGDHAFIPHLMNLLGKESIWANLRFEKFQHTATDRKELALRAHEAVLRLRAKSPN